MGGVYRARDESLGRLVAIKVMLTSMGEDEAFVERFKMEAQAAAKLNHPNIVTVHEVELLQACDERGGDSWISSRPGHPPP